MDPIEYDDKNVKGDMLPEEGLFSLEKLDRASPDLWPEKIPGMTEFIASSDTPIRKPKPEWAQGLSQENINEMMQLATLSTPMLLREIRDLLDQGYQLGLQEAKQMTRGKYLGIFNNVKTKKISNE